MKRIKVLTVYGGERSRTDPYGGTVTFTVMDNNNKCVITTSPDALEVPGARFKIIRNLLICLKK
jgi:hypothetical protein